MRQVAISLQEKIATNVAVDPSTGCWLWQKSIANTGYGQLYHAGGQMNAHRAAWLAYRGPLTNEECVLHRCDVRACCNPEHLFKGDRGDNRRDMDSKGRAVPPRGIRAARAVLNDELVRGYRARHAGGESIAELAREFGMSHEGMSQAVKGITWKHVL